MIEILCSGLEGQTLLQLTSRIAWRRRRELNPPASPRQGAALPESYYGINWLRV